MTKNRAALYLASSFEARAHLHGEGDSVITGVKRLKVLEFLFDEDGGVWSQVNSVRAKLRSRSWALAKLKKCGLMTS